MKISIFGAGYVGLVTGLCFAELGHNVISVDRDDMKISMIKNKKTPIFEKGLDELLQTNLSKGFSITNDYKFAIRETDISFIAVGTPLKSGNIDLDYVEQVCKTIGRELKNKKEYHLIVIKSTVLPGTTDGLVTKILEKSSGKTVGHDFGVAMNPEFLREGVAVEDFMNPDRIVIGSNDNKAMQKLVEVYKVFSTVDVIKTNCVTAEMTKYSSNALYANLISFSNEIANLSSSIKGVDALEVMKGVCLDNRISPSIAADETKKIRPGIVSYLSGGVGYGGSCFPKDIKAIKNFARSRNVDMRVLDAVEKTNENQHKKVIDLLKKHFSSLSKINIGVLGLGFKEGTDDLRESPSIKVINLLLAENAIVHTYDPIIKESIYNFFERGSITIAKGLSDIISLSDAIIVLTKDDHFTTIPKVCDELKNNKILIVDGRRLLPVDGNYIYEGMGRG